MSELTNDNQLKLDLNETAQAQIDIREDRENLQDHLEEKYKEERDKLLETPPIEPAPAPGMSTQRNIQGEYDRLQTNQMLEREKIDTFMDGVRGDIRASGTTPTGEFEKAANISQEMDGGLAVSSIGPTGQDVYGPQAGGNEPQNSSPDTNFNAAHSKSRGRR